MFLIYLHLTLLMQALLLILELAGLASQVALRILCLCLLCKDCDQIAMFSQHLGGLLVSEF